MKAPACFPEYKFDCIHREITDTGTAFTEVKTVRKYRRRASDGTRQIVEQTLSCGRSVAEMCAATR